MTRPIVWTIAGSDNCSGAGIQADLKTFEMIGVHGCTVIAALTAQNTQRVYQTQSVSAEMLNAQIESLKADMPPRAIKIGMLGDAASVRALIAQLKTLDSYVVYDPVMVASTGSHLLSDEVIDLVKHELLPCVNLLTPNLVEAEKLSGINIQTEQDLKTATQKIISFGVKSVVIKGWQHNGHAMDYYQNADRSFFLISPLRAGLDARGTGCSFASICAAARALGMDEGDAVTLAKAKINQMVRMAQNIGQGMPILSYKKSAPSPEDLPWLSEKPNHMRQQFPDCGQDLGFYPVVDSIEWLERLLPLGVTTAQLRIKNKSGAALENEITAAIALGKKYNCRLFINDYWQLAIKHDAYGVHLGQEDLVDADLQMIANAGLRLGISTHSCEELAHAHAYRPSYIALGPIYHTTLKAMRFAPQGLQTLADWRRMLNYPLVAIGGITLERAPEVMATGADSIAVVSDITQNKNPEARTKDWLKFFRNLETGSEAAVAKTAA